MPIRENRAKGWFKTAPQPRHSMPAIQEMQASLEEHGQLQDVAALPDGTLIYGHRRLAAAMLSKIVTTLWVLIYDEPLSAKEIHAIQLVENVQREDLTPYELACGVRSLVNEGMEQKEVAKRLGKGPTWVSRYMYPWKCILAVQEAFKAGAIGITDTETLAKVSPEEQQVMLATRLGNQASRDDLVRHQQQSRPGNGEKKGIVRLRFEVDGVLILLSGKGMTLPTARKAMQAGVKAMRKAEAEKLNGRAFEAAMSCKAKEESNGTP